MLDRLKRAFRILFYGEPVPVEEEWKGEGKEHVPYFKRPVIGSRLGTGECAKDALRKLAISRGLDPGYYEVDVDKFFKTIKGQSDTCLGDALENAEVAALMGGDPGYYEVDVDKFFKTRKGQSDTCLGDALENAEVAALMGGDPGFVGYMAEQKEDHLFEWVSEPMSGKNRNWGSFTFYVAAGYLKMDGEVVTGSKIYAVLCYVNGDKIESNEIFPAPDQRVPLQRCYGLHVYGKDAESPAVLKLTSESPFSVSRISPLFNFKPEYIAEWKRVHEFNESIPDPGSRAGMLFYEQHPELLP